MANINHMIIPKTCCPYYCSARVVVARVLSNINSTDSALKTLYRCRRSDRQCRVSNLPPGREF